MAPKRSIEWNGEHSLSIDDHEPPTKRRLTSLIPHTPLPKHTHTQQPRTPFTSTSTPFPPRPSDSPSNPFGRKRIQILSHSLPPPTSFSKHLPLRFQLVHPGVSPRLGGIYRVVQVPLSYTFAQLRCLITWLFGGGYAPDNGREDRHLFELKKKIVMYSPTYKPCQIRSGFTAVKLSTARDPCRYRPEDDEDALYDESATPHSDADAEQHSEDGDEDADEGWTWEAEEEYTLGNVWSRGGDLQRGIIYHHTPDTAVHITVNVGPLPRRKGVSNTPYVFQGRGRVRLLPPSPLPLPRPVFSVPTHKLPVPSSPARPSPTQAQDDQDEYEDEDEDEDEEYGDASSSGFFFLNSNNDEDHTEEMPSDENDSEEEETQPDDPTAPIDPAKYNAPNAFAAYLRFAHQHRRRCEFSFSSSSSSDEEFDCDVRGATPGLVYGDGSSSSPMKPSSSSSPIKSSSSSSPIKPMTHFPSSSSSSPLFGSGTYYDPQTSLSHSLSSFAAYTPAPAHHASWQRLRLERVRKRMERAKQVSGLSVGFEEGEEEEVDELALDLVGVEGVGVGKGNGGEGWGEGGKGGMGGGGNGGGRGGGGGGGRGNGKWKMGKDGEGEVWVKPGVVWDPFADELEV